LDRMRTLSEHNAIYEKLLADHKRRLLMQEKKLSDMVDPAGVQCPKCKQEGHEVEMVYYNRGNWKPRYLWENYWSNPVRCMRCGYKGFKKDVFSKGT